ncbi:MAG: type II toxin-antitoxin system VapC family toxin [Bacteroidales bacterium]|nr:type II toxin-antitoxin system VapC family toxin [Bacteroidales bacterium]
MEQKYLIDTNVLIDAQMNRLPSKGKDFLAKVINKNFIISFITQIEYLGYKDVSKSSEALISLADIIRIDEQIIQTCIDIRKKHKIKVPDAIIAATAITRNLTLITNNEDDFIGLQDLLFINLHSM